MYNHLTDSGGVFVLITAIITITLALVFYTLAVFMERKRGALTIFHTVLFGMGLAFDTTGTLIMGQIAQSSPETVTGLNWHAITGALAIALMAFHLTWAIFVLIKKDKKTQKKFHQFSFLVWLIWLIPYFSGVFVGMN